MPLESCFSIRGRGTVVTGRIERGTVKVGDEIEIIGLRASQKTICTGVEMFRKELGQGQAGDNVGILLRSVKREDVERGQVLVKPGSMGVHDRFEAEIYCLTEAEGGRHTPFFSNYRPQFFFKTADVSGYVGLSGKTKMVMPGDNVTITVDLLSEAVIEQGMRFALREGGRTVGAGVVSKLLPKLSVVEKEKVLQSYRDSKALAVEAFQAEQAAALQAKGGDEKKGPPPKGQPPAKGAAPAPAGGKPASSPSSTPKVPPSAPKAPATPAAKPAKK